MAIAASLVGCSILSGLGTLLGSGGCAVISQALGKKEYQKIKACTSLCCYGSPAIPKDRQMMQKVPVFHEDQDVTFYYIAGYTSGGAPYGVTWKEMSLKSDIWEPDDQGGS